MYSSFNTPYAISSHLFGRQSNNSDGAPLRSSVNASPPLILAFLAIGVFALSMIGVFGWRRLNYTRVRQEIPRREGQDDQRPPRAGLGPRPKLWDLWTIDMTDGYKQNKGSTSGSDRTSEHETWDTIMPISVVMSPPYPTKDDSTTSQTPQPTAAPFYRWARHIHPTTSAAGRCISRPKAEGNNGHDERRIQVAVAIAMPSASTMHDAARNTRVESRLKEGGTEDTFAYTLGVYECPWGHDNG